MRRRDFIKLIGTASGATLVTSCGLKKKTDKLIPYLVPPEDGVVPGQPIYSNSTCTECPAGCGLQVNAREKLDGREYKRYPIKLEGVAGHPINDGALCVRGQSSLTRLYHPERIREPLIRDSKGILRKTSWEEVSRAILEVLENAAGEKLPNYYLSSRVTGTLSGLIERFCAELSVEKLPEYEFYSHSAVRQANGMLFGKPYVPHYRIDEADFLLTVGADILDTHVSPVAYSLMFASASERQEFRWYHAEPHISLTGLRANHRLAARPGSEPILLAYLLGSIAGTGLSRKEIGPGPAEGLVQKVSLEDAARETGIEAARLAGLRDELLRSAKPLVIVGGVSTAHRQGLEAALLGALIQWSTGATDSLVDFSKRENYDDVGSARDLEKLSRLLERDGAGVVFLSKVHELPARQALAKNLKRAKLVVGMSDQYRGVMKECDIVLPLSHPLETWGDAEPRKGLRTLIQPVLEPLYNTMSEGDVLIRLLESSGRPVKEASYQEYLYSRWKERMGEEGIKGFMERGYREESPRPEKVSLRPVGGAARLRRLESGPADNVLVVSPSLRKFDGRSSELPLLSEIPDPISSVSYGKWVSVSEETAKELRLRDGDEVEIAGEGFTTRLPVKLQRWLPAGVVSVLQEAAGDIPLEVDGRTGELVAYYGEVKVSKAATTIPLPILAGPLAEDEREIIPWGGAEGHEGEEHTATLFPEHEHHDYSWAMAIDLDRCTGCSACVAACYIENNIPVVGPKEHLKGREMSWIRIEQHDRESDRPQFMPMLCQHCHSAPCETVCPVYAAYHTDEGLNAQVYNRCVGTRYCSNNCPYKVRRFNWFDHDWPEPMDKMLNPDLSVRTKGIMEKCTFCVQRIRAARDTAKDEDRKIRDGEVTPACAQTCPTKAIVFGSMVDEKSRVHKIAGQSHSYRALESLGTLPSVYYLTKGSDKDKA